jgi:hypothetical protein
VRGGTGWSDRLILPRMGRSTPWRLRRTSRSHTRIRVLNVSLRPPSRGRRPPRSAYSRTFPPRPPPRSQWESAGLVATSRGEARRRTQSESLKPTDSSSQSCRFPCASQNVYG